MRSSVPCPDLETIGASGRPAVVIAEAAATDAAAVIDRAAVAAAITAANATNSKNEPLARQLRREVFFSGMILMSDE